MLLCVANILTCTDARSAYSISVESCCCSPVGCLTHMFEGLSAARLAELDFTSFCLSRGINEPQSMKPCTMSW